MSVRPFTIAEAKAFCALTHRRQPKVLGARWALRLMEAGEVVGVALVAHPQARMLDDGDRLEVVRVAVREAAGPNGHASSYCSALYGACSRAARSMGASDLLTYIHHDEPGTSLKAAGWIELNADRYLAKSGDWSRAKRPRAEPVDLFPKRRFFAPWSETIRRWHESIAQAKQTDAGGAAEI